MCGWEPRYRKRKGPPRKVNPAAASPPYSHSPIQAMPAQFFRPPAFRGGRVDPKNMDAKGAKNEAHLDRLVRLCDRTC